MNNNYINNFNYSIFLGFLLLVLVIGGVVKQDRVLINIAELERLLILKRIISLDSLYPFDQVAGVFPDEQKRHRYNVEFVKDKFVEMTIPILPVNTPFVESDSLPGRGLYYNCFCDSAGNEIADKESAFCAFLTYKIIVLDKQMAASDIKFNGFILFATNTNIVRDPKSGRSCLHAGRIKYFLQTDRFNANPFPEYTLDSIKTRLAIIKHLNRARKISDEEFYLNSISEKQQLINIPLLGIPLDTRESALLVNLISISFATFSINMLRRAVREFSKNKKKDAFLLYEVSRDVGQSMKLYDRLGWRSLRFDSFLILLYHFICFAAPLFIFFCSLTPSYNNLNSFTIDLLRILMGLMASGCVYALFFNYAMLFQSIPLYRRPFKMYFLFRSFSEIQFIKTAGFYYRGFRGRLVNCILKIFGEKP